jgi:hypothetical protein
MRSAHHATLRSCPGLLPSLHRLLLPGARGWTELKATAKKILTNLGELEDTNRPLHTLSPAQLRALLEGQGIDAARLAERSIGGAEFVRLSNAELQELGGLGQGHRLLRVLRAHEAFADIDACGTRDGAVSLGKLVVWLGNRGFRCASFSLAFMCALGRLADTGAADLPGCLSVVLLQLCGAQRVCTC